eukprot:jgi/Picsp_1/3979/NSC_01491-R1_---NA---
MEVVCFASLSPVVSTEHRMSFDARTCTEYLGYIYWPICVLGDVREKQRPSGRKSVPRCGRI